MDEPDGPIRTPQVDSPRVGFTQYCFNRETWAVKNRYCDLEPLNLGAFGTVCRAFDQEVQQAVAIKRLNQPLLSVDHAKRTLREIRLLRFFKDHENLLAVVDAFTSGASVGDMADVYLVTILMQADLGSVLRSDDISLLPQEHTMFFMYQMLRGLKYLHSAGVIHRDLKPANLAINEDSSLKIIDYGLSRSISTDLTGYVVTRYYRAPEVMFNFQHYNEKVDVWSVGCIFAEMISGDILFPAEDHVDLLKRIVKLCGKPSPEEIADYLLEDMKDFLIKLPEQSPNFWQHFSFVSDRPALDLLHRMLVVNPDKRISVEEALKHAYFETLHDESDEPKCPELFSSSDFEGQSLSLPQYRQLIWEELSKPFPVAVANGV